jgi:predicted transposase/invertase (TIGR01784 family)
MSEKITTLATDVSESSTNLKGFIDPYSDFGFKHIFGREPNRDFLIRFLNAIFKDNKVIVDIQYNTNEFKGLGKDYRKTIFDLYCTGDKGEKFIVEMQNIKDKNFKERSVFYTSNLISEQGRGVIADWDYKLPEIYFVAIMNFTFDDGRPDHFLHDIRLIDINTHDDFYPKLSYIFIEMPKFKKSVAELETELDEWLYILNNLNKNEEIPLSLLGKAGYEKVLEIAAIGNLTPEEMNEYEQSLKIQRDNYSALKSAKEEAMAEGLAEGLAGGLAEGKAQGLVEGKAQGLAEGKAQGIELGEHKKALEMARQMLADHEPLEKIVRYTKLTMEEIEKL